MVPGRGASAANASSTSNSSSAILLEGVPPLAMYPSKALLGLAGSQGWAAALSSSPSDTSETAPSAACRTTRDWLAVDSILRSAGAPEEPLLRADGEF